MLNDNHKMKNGVGLFALILKRLMEAVQATLLGCVTQGTWCEGQGATLQQCQMRTEQDTTVVQRGPDPRDGERTVGHPVRSTPDQRWGPGRAPDSWEGTAEMSVMRVRGTHGTLGGGRQHRGWCWK